jgi:hypothetical protein
MHNEVHYSSTEHFVTNIPTMQGNKTPLQELQLPQQREDTTGILYPLLMSEHWLRKAHIKAGIERSYFGRL